MTVAYRNKFTAYKQDHEANYASIGSIFPVPVDSFSTDPAHALGGAGSGGETMEYSYKGYLYCDGRELNIRDYPQLYYSIRNTYGGSTTSKPTQSSNAGGMRRITWIGNKCFINFYRDPDIAGGNKLPYPYGTAFRMVDDTGETPAGPGLGSMPAGDWDYNIFYTTQLPTETLSVPNGEFAYEVVFPETIDPATLPKNNVDITTGTHPTITLNKSFTYADSPHQVGTFKLPDYRDRIIVGLGDVDGEGTPTVENALVNSVGQTGGQWYISKDNILDGGVFFSIGDVRTTGYQNITADVFTFITGSVDFRIGPIDDHIFNRPVEHNHYILSSVADDAIDNERDGVPIDEFAVNYVTGRANILPFEPVGQGGLALGHSHGLTREKLNDPSLATFGNTSGPGGVDPNQPADISWDVTDSAVTSTAVYNNVALEDHGPGTGEYEGFLKAGVAQSNQYLAFGYKAAGNLGASDLRQSRSVQYTLDFTGYTQLYVFAVAGNDNNGGERPNNTGEGLFCEFSNGESLRLFPSVQDYIAENGLGTTEGFDLYDAIHSNWREFVIDIPAALQDQPNQVVTLRQNLSSPTPEQGPSVPAGNDNANDMLGIQVIGLRGGIIEDPPEPDGCYPITGSPIIPVLSAVYDSGNNYVLVTTQEAHGFSKGDYITIQGAIPDTAGMYNGTFQILDSQFSSDSFTYTPESTPTLGTAAGTISVRIAAGTFEDVTTTPAPRLYAIDGQTVIGGKADIFTPPGTGTIFQTDELLSQGSFTLPAVAASEGIVTRIDIDLRAPGGGGGGTSGDGGTGGYAYVTLDIGGTTYTCYAYGGGGGQAGDNGGSGGSGGTYLVPAALLALDSVSIAGSNDGAAGSNGGQFGSGTIPGGSGSGQGGNGGVGASGTFITSTDSGFVTQGGTSWTAPSNIGVSSRTVTIRIAGGGGGGGNGNANSGCQAGSTQAPFGDGTATGGSGGAGALVTANCGFGPSTFTWTLGRGGQPGFNNVDGYVNGNGPEAGISQGGTGASPGGQSGRGYWGNGSTGGGGGGSTGVFWDGGIPFLGAGGGGGGGGSGGGYNGSGTTDGCYAGGNNQGAAANLNGQTTALDFTFGSNGTTGNCTAGGGGGGGGGCGIGGQANGGVGGQAGQGHNGNGGGTGGARGRSAYRTDYCNASWGTAGNGGAPGSSGGDGYVQIRVQDETENDGRLGGGGGQGAHLLMAIANTNTSITCGLQSAGANGGDGSANGSVGYVKAEYRGTIPGEDVEGNLSNPSGGYYECDASGVPGGSRIDSNIWKSSSANGDSKEVLLKPVVPGNGTGSAGKFQMSTSANGDPPRYGTRATRYLPFAGEGTREYVIGPLDLSNAEKIQWSVIRGTGLNGGDAPEEDLLLYYRIVGSSTVNLLGVVKSSTGGDSTWSEQDVNIPSNSNARNTAVELILSQNRVLTQDDNANLTVDNYGVSAMTIFYGEVTERVFTPTDGTEICDIDFVDRTVNVVESGISADEGTFTMSSSTPITVTSEAIPENNIPLITKYHRVKYLIKAV